MPIETPLPPWAADAARPERHLVRLDSAQTLSLLADVSYGRIVFTDRALPAIRPVNHVIDNGDVIVRMQSGGPLAQAVFAHNAVVAYEADEIDPQTRLGWSAVITGKAQFVTDREEIARLEAAMAPWLDEPNDMVVRIRPQIIDGFRLAAVA